MANLLFYMNDRRAAMRVLGESAMNELYFSWDDSVKNAVERYRVILNDREHYRKPRQITGSEDFFRTVSQWFGIYSQLVTMPSRVQERAETLLRPLLPLPERKSNKKR